MGHGLGLEFHRGRLLLPVAGDEASTLLGALDRIRATFAWKASGLSVEQMGTALAPSTITITGLVRHLAFVEDFHFTLRLQAWMPAPRDGVGWDATPDWPWTSAREDTPEQSHDFWRSAVVRSRKAIPCRRAALQQQGPSVVSPPHARNGSSTDQAGPPRRQSGRTPAARKGPGPGGCRAPWTRRRA